MMGPTHRILGAHQGVILGGATGSLWGAGGAVSGAFLWAGLGYACATLPDRMERPLGIPHRTVTHWPEPPIIGGLIALAVAAGPFGWGVWLIFMAIAGICCSILSHWIGDFIFGKAHTRDNPNGGFTVIRPRGVPYLFGTRYRGLGVKVDSLSERYLRRFLYWSFPGTIIIMFYLTLGG